MNYYIGHSTDSVVRFSSSSGGVGTAIIKYLLENNLFGSSVTFVYSHEECRYIPQIIHTFKDYNNCGSIYQDTDTIRFIRDNIKNIKNGIVVTCMPCQVKAIRSILNHHHIDHFIISMCCSGQTTVQGTWLYYKLLGIDKKDVNSIQYRGNGWPSGIQIELDNGNVIRRDNYTYPWTLMHQSLLFRPKRCLSCTIKTSPDADISLADPWLKEYIDNDKIGNTIVISNEKGDRIITDMIKTGNLNLDAINESVYVSSQLGTIKLKQQSNLLKSFNRIVAAMGKEDSIYKRIVTSSEFLLKLHVKFLYILKKYYEKRIGDF